MTFSALWLPDAIRDMGVEPVEVDGWQDLGHGDVDPQVFVSHHTADGPNGTINSLGVVRNGAPYTAPGPLANILQSREPGEGNDKAYIIAAGTTYNAGTGGWNGISGNVHTIGNEIEHTGLFPLPQHRVETACKIAAGCLLAMGRGAEYHCHHWEWSYPPGSKIDVCCGNGPNGKCDGPEWRDLTTRYMRGGGLPPLPPLPEPEEDDDMKVYITKASDPSVGAWELAGNTRRHILIDEWNFDLLAARLNGKPPPVALPISDEWWNSIPEVTG